MRVSDRFHLVRAGGFDESSAYRSALTEIEAAVQAVVWPPGADDFSIYPESGKKRNEGNGVRPIRNAFVEAIENQGWTAELPFPTPTGPEMANFGDMDASKKFGTDVAVVEWESGNISSSHRAMNKMAVGLLAGDLAMAVLVVPTKPFARYLTDRIGNLYELQPYFPLWSSLRVERGYLGVYAVEHDRESHDVPRIPKGTDGRSAI